MKQTKLTYNLDGLNELSDTLKNKYVARVGILGDKASATHKGTKLTNSEIGFIQMFGSYTKKIPARDFLLMPLEHERKELTKALSSGAVKKAVQDGEYKKVFKLLGVAAEEIIQNAFATRGFGQWAPNAPSTIASKNSASPLINTSQLRKSITSEVVDRSNT